MDHTNDLILKFWFGLIFSYFRNKFLFHNSLFEHTISCSNLFSLYSLGTEPHKNQNKTSYFGVLINLKLLLVNNQHFLMGFLFCPRIRFQLISFEYYCVDLDSFATTVTTSYMCPRLFTKNWTKYIHFQVIFKN